ncbi:hypothetical protein [Butyrivibrio sp. AE3003]|uniref:hypothetical protein n=1 Tax=Butyrivibrio sp. AE3003 TaxID=1496721 RepID=UPI00047D24A7|nr:hypothetical protein [Butyrivibrio sp. AE3003]
MRGFDAEAPHRKVVEDVCGAKAGTGTAQKGCRGSVRCENAARHRTERLWRKCTVRKSEQAPHRKVVEEVCGAKMRLGTAQRGCGGSVRCENAIKHRTERLWKMRAVRKCDQVPHRKAVEDTCGAKVRKSTV